MNKIKILIASIILLTGSTGTFGFVMTGPMVAGQLAGGGVNFNITDDLGGPKELKQFFRWNMPYLTYSFDLSFVQYFGIEGMAAVDEAFRVVNDFFIPEDGSYSGVSSMDFARDGFLSNYNTAWVNTTAQNEQIIDLKSIVLGYARLGAFHPECGLFFKVLIALSKESGTCLGGIKLTINTETLGHMLGCIVFKFGIRQAHGNGCVGALHFTDLNPKKSICVLHGAAGLRELFYDILINSQLLEMFGTHWPLDPQPLPFKGNVLQFILNRSIQ